MTSLSLLTQHVTRRPQRIALLAQIAALGSITQAAKAAGMSYKTAWDAVDELNNLAERPLVERSVGGKGGGGARLTPAGERLLALYQRLEELRERMLETLEEDGEDLELIGRLMLRTSARNQLHGRVCSIEPAGLNDLIGVDLPGGARIQARITRESTEKLELREGLPVVALMKAGWLYVDLPQIECPAGLNALEGRVEDIREAGDGPSEVRIQLPGGQMLCALVDQERIDILRLVPGSRVRTQFSPAQVILGTPV
ncbi:molybdate transport system regulatory protein [Pseudomonas citronellolis]|uniref:Molybdate transport system regulatory protein n=1 Tax=Pseudomonas citronellolis TaxID=53408 RepID=A0AAQ1KKC9_9PSED|nr:MULTISPECIES: TOBE domain-containing protein [Pseudomonas]MCL6689662.1 TOBE domain-containing protein [Pseudomonas sp. R3.Fl]TGC28370.1 molybdenum-dependent transcriptional regulator [Pseudomonas citronellolis]SFD62310.1 molybdate transport system regulatory protein [Pseudomonas citronellolis]